MPSLPSLLLTSALFLLPAAGLLHAADAPSPAEQKLRDTVRQTMLQMRTLQGERDTLQAEKQALEGEKSDLSSRLERLTKESATRQAELEQALAQTQEKLARQETQTSLLEDSLAKWRTAQKQAATLAEEREGARTRLKSENLLLQRRVAAHARKNLELCRIGSEILSRYENFGLATALTAREPFVGQTRVRLQNLAQEMEQQLEAQRIEPEPATAAPEAGRQSAPAAPRSPAPAEPSSTSPSTRARS